MLPALAAVYLIWGSTYLAIRFALEGGFPPFLLGGIRFIIAGSLMFAFLRWRRRARADRAAMAQRGGDGRAVAAARQRHGQPRREVRVLGLAAVAVASAPLWMGVFAALRGQHPSRIEWIGLGIGFLSACSGSTPTAA